MEVAIYLIPIGIIFGCVILGLLLWNIKSGQYGDLDGEAARMLHQDEKGIKQVSGDEKKL